MEENKTEIVPKTENNWGLIVKNNPILSNILSELDPEYLQLLAETLTTKEISKLINYAKKIECGSIKWTPIICKGGECIYKHTCPLVRQPPLGQECLFEKRMMDTWTSQYVTALKVDLNSHSDKSQLNDIVEADIMNARANAILADEGFTMQNAVGVDHETGEAILRTEINIAMNVKEYTQNRRDKLLKTFLGTRESKMKIIQAAEDPTKYMASLRDRAERAISKLDGRTVEAEFVEKKEDDHDNKVFKNEGKAAKDKTETAGTDTNVPGVKGKDKPKEEFPW